METYLLHNPETDTFYVNLDQVELWHNSLKRQGHNVVVIENERFDEISKNIESGIEVAITKMPIMIQLTDNMNEDDIQMNNGQVVDYSKYKTRAKFAALCFGFIFADSIYLLNKYFDGALMISFIMLASALVTLISLFALFVYWCYEQD